MDIQFIGERGFGCPLDLKLMKYIHIANIACGGHAGDRDSVEFFSSLAKRNNVRIAAHLSYPDRNSFGRKSMKLPVNELFNSFGVLSRKEAIEINSTKAGDIALFRSTFSSK